MKTLLENWRQFVDESLLVEGQRGTAFERVVVQVAGGAPARPQDLTHKVDKVSFEALAKQALGHMGIAPGTLTPDTAFVHTATPAGGGDPKTDLVLNGIKVSLKMPGGIQLVSGGYKTAIADLSAAEAEVLGEEILEALEETLEEEAEEKILTDTQNLISRMQEGLGVKWLPVGCADSGGYEGLIRAKYKKEWDKKRKKGDQDFISQNPNEEAFVAGKVNEAKAWVGNRERFAKDSWEAYRDTLPDLNTLLEKVMEDDGMRHALIDEWITGRRRFAAETDHIPDYLLDPNGVHDVRTTEQTAKLAKDWGPYLKANIRAKGRKWLSKEPALRVDFDAKKYYAELMKDSHFCPDDEGPESVDSDQQQRTLRSLIEDPAVGDLNVDVSTKENKD